MTHAPLLPLEVVAKLKVAARVGTPGSTQRAAAIQKVIDTARKQYPHLFIERKEQQNG